jgi:hypothetical protein
MLFRNIGSCKEHDIWKHEIESWELRFIDYKLVSDLQVIEEFGIKR